MTCKERLETYLREHQVRFQTQHHSLAYTAQELAASEHVPGKQVAKVVMVLGDGRPSMLALPATHRVDLAKVGRAVGAKEIRLAQEEELAAYLPDCEVGAMPPFGNLYGLPVVVDKALAVDESIVFPAGTHTDTISLEYADFARLVEPAVASIAYHE